MIIFQSSGFQLDLTLLRISFNEESNIYIDNIIKSYTFPFKVSLLDDFVKNIGFPNIQNVSSNKALITGQLIIDDDYFEASMRVGARKGEQVEVTLYYGEEELDVYSTKMANLPWPINLVVTTQELAGKHLDKGWPEVTHNFPAIFRPSIQEKSDYNDFQFFVNNYNGNDFVSNTQQTIESEVFFFNRNVLSPCAYLVEMVGFGYQVAGKKLRGSFFEDPAIQKLLYIPEQYQEKFKGSTFTNWQFDLPGSTEDLNGLNVGVYQRVFAPTVAGTYTVKFNIELDEVLASYFNLRIYRLDTGTSEETDEFAATSVNNRVSINKEIEINLTGTAPFEQIIVEMRLPYTVNSVGEKNSFEYAFKEGRLNQLDSSYSLASFMPDMTFGDFVNTVKNWLNLDISIDEEFAYIEFVEKTIDNFSVTDHSHLEERYPEILDNDNRVFKLTYGNGDEVLVDSSGQIYSDAERQAEDIITIDMGVEMAKVEENYGRQTAVHPEGGLVFAIYDGLNGNGRNMTIDSYDGFTGKIENIYSKYWSQWLFRRTTNKTITDKFRAHFTELLNVRSKIYKYNYFLLPKRFRKRRISQQYWEVEMEAETI